MAGKIKKKISKTKSLSLEGFLNLDNLNGFVMEIEEEGEVDVTDLLKELNSEYVTLSLKIKQDIDLDPSEPFEKDE